MTPKNRAELVAWLADLSSTENAQGREHRHALGDQFAERIVAALDAAGLAIVPKEPTEDMLRPCDDYTDQITNANVYRAMLYASPFKEPGE